MSNKKPIYLECIIRRKAFIAHQQFLVTSPLGFNARVGSALFALSGGVHYMFPEIHFWCYTCRPLGSWQCSRSLPYMHQQRWDLIQIRTSDLPYRRRTRYHCASDQHNGDHQQFHIINSIDLYIFTLPRRIIFYIFTFLSRTFK